MKTVSLSMSRSRCLGRTQAGITFSTAALRSFPGLRQTDGIYNEGPEVPGTSFFSSSPSVMAMRLPVAAQALEWVRS